MEFPDYLTEEQKRFWSPENWRNLRLYGEDVGILGVFFDKKKNDEYPVTVIYRDSDGDIIRPYYSVDGRYVNSNERFVEEPRPKKTVAWGKEDFIKHRNCLFIGEDTLNEIVNGIFMIDIGCNRIKLSSEWQWLSFEHVAKHLQYSPDDGITWLPCTKEVAK